MKKILEYLSVTVILALCLCSCAKKVSTATNEASKRYFDAWMTVNYPDLEPTALGAYVISETEGDGELVGDYENAQYVRVHYTSYDLDWTLVSSTSMQYAQQVGDYKEGNFYGPRFWVRTDDTFYAGLDEAISTMRVGGTKRVIIPGWLHTSNRYDSAADYVNKVSASNSDHAIYDIEIVEIVEDVTEWQLDSIAAYLSHNFPEVSIADSLMYGLYYIQRKAPVDTTSFASDTTLYINYIARRLDGQVVDTNIRDTAKRYGIYNSSTTYAPRKINWYNSSNDEDYMDITMSSSSSSTSSSSESTLNEGFSYILNHMRSYEKGTGIFYSNLAYGASGSGNRIPEYCPIRFDIEYVDEED